MRYQWLHSITLGLSLIFSSNRALTVFADSDPAGRERLLLDKDWRFAFGHPTDPGKDFNFGTGYFSYLAKAGYGDGPAAAGFDDAAWRLLDLPHDWAVEAPFDGRGSHSHGYKAIGRRFPDACVGWYRKRFYVPESDLGRRIRIEFDGVFRDAKVWINGQYLGNEPSGYTGFGYNLGEFLNYGGTNVISVRVDASMEEGWFYEGAGIYRHVWLVKTDPLHVVPNGTFVSSSVKADAAEVTARATVVNDSTNEAVFDIEQALQDPGGKTVAVGRIRAVRLGIQEAGDYAMALQISNPELWSVETPRMYQLITRLVCDGRETDRYATPFGIRDIRFDPDHGFFLNGRRVELKGVNCHQDHAGVGVAIPDALQEFRIRQLKSMGCNACRCSHNPPTPEFLDACDRLGMLVIDENRLMGTSETQLDYLRRLMVRDRNHPSVILWSLGNEEWGLEGNVKGARVTAAMQAFARRLDPTRRFTVAISGGWGGTSKAVDVVGYNYIHQTNPDRQHAEFPNQPGVGTEESSSQGTRGVYVDDRAHCHLAPLERGDSGGNCEIGWKYYAARPFLAGLFFWTGFDYRGEPTPFGWPAISSQFGILDTCGFPKDSFYYLKSWWTEDPVVHVATHWNWPGREGKPIKVVVFSNCGEVELFLNGRTLGRKTMERNSHLEWDVPYVPGELVAKGINDAREAASDRVETAGAPASIQLIPDRASIRADGEDVSIITVRVNDAKGRWVPVADNLVSFELQGPARIIGVGNGDPSSHERDRFVDQVELVEAGRWRTHAAPEGESAAAVSADFDDSEWATAFNGGRRDPSARGATNIFRGKFEMSEITNATVSLFLRGFGNIQSAYVNGRSLPLDAATASSELPISSERLKAATNTLAIVASPSRNGGRRDDSRDDFRPAVLRICVPAGAWERSVFNGLAQVIVQSTGNSGSIRLLATAPGLASTQLELSAERAPSRASVP